MNQKIANNNFTSIEQMTGKFLPKKIVLSQETKQVQPSFETILHNKELETGLKFSKHANVRLESRNIKLSNEQLKRLEHGARKAREKGIQESLVMMDNIAFIVNVKNNTVITAVNDSNDKVFTNIDGAVII